MSNLFGNLKSEGLEQAEDRLGGGYQAKDTDAYPATIKMAYAGQSDGGARNVTIVADINGSEYRETIYITNKKGENYFLNKNDQSKKVPLPGFTTIDHLCLIASGMPLCDQPTEDKIIKVWDSKERKEVNKSVPTLPELAGKEVILGLVKQTVDVTEKADNGEYVPTGKTRDENVIDKVFDVDTKLTVVEAMNGLEEGVFYTNWVEKNRGVTRDRTSKDAAGQTGKSGRPAGGPPQSGGVAPKKSLFGNKASAA